MPRYQLPPIRENEPAQAENTTMPSPSGEIDVWERTVAIPVNKAILEALAVGGEAEVTLRGRVSGLSSSEQAEGRGSTTLSLVISSVDAYPENESMEEDDMDGEDVFEKSFNKARGRFTGKRY